MERFDESQPLYSDSTSSIKYPLRQGEYRRRKWMSQPFGIIITLAATLALVLSIASFLVTIENSPPSLSSSPSRLETSDSPLSSVNSSPVQMTKATHSAKQKPTSNKKKPHTSPTSSSYLAKITSVGTLPTEALQVYDCGDDMEQALQKGCLYDVLLAAWTPPQCFNQTLYDEFYDPEPEWTYYLDDQAAKTVRPSLVDTGRYMQLFTSYKFHIQHCLYFWRKQTNALAPGGAWVEEMVLEPIHAEHCSRMVTGENLHKSKTAAMVLQTFQRCVRVDAYRANSTGLFGR
jgi:hypothetical protein